MPVCDSVYINCVCCWQAGKTNDHTTAVNTAHVGISDGKIDNTTEYYGDPNRTSQFLLMYFIFSLAG